MRAVVLAVGILVLMALPAQAAMLSGIFSFDNRIAALTEGSLRGGIDVQGFSNGGSEPFANNTVPEPATMFLLGTGLFGVGLWARRRLAQRRVVEV